MRTGTRIVHATDALKRLIDAERSIRANIKVLAYIPTRRMIPITAMIRFPFFINITLIQSQSTGKFEPGYNNTLIIYTIQGKCKSEKNWNKN